MNNKKMLLVFLALVFIVSGCASRTPHAVNFPSTSQHMVRSAHHWDVIAADTAQETIRVLLNNSYLDNLPVYIQKKEKLSEFEKGFYEFLTTHLVQHGVTITENPQRALTLSYDTMIIKHRGDRSPSPQGALTKLAAGYMVYRNLIVGTPSAWIAGATVLGTTALIDRSIALYDSPSHTEIMVTTSIKENNEYVMRKSDVYYVEDFNRSLFQVQAPAKKLELVGR